MELGEGNENGAVDSASDERVNRLARHLVLIGILIAWAGPLAAQDNAQPRATDTPADPADVLPVSALSCCRPARLFSRPFSSSTLRIEFTYCLKGRIIR
jgi:hypothetical protein